MIDNETIENLFISVKGKIYVSNKFPTILKDEKALEIEDKIPSFVKDVDTKNQYALLSGVVRYANLDRYVKTFLEEYEDGIIVQLGCGLETSCYRNSYTNAKWYEVDKPEIIDYRESILGKASNEVFIKADPFSEDWIKQIKDEQGDKQILVIAAGLFYYFSEEKVMQLFKTFNKYGNIEIVFDTVNSVGMRQISGDSGKSYFCVDSPLYLSEETGAEVLKEEGYFASIPKKGLKFMTKMSMKFSDSSMTIKMEHLKFNGIENVPEVVEENLDDDDSDED